MDRHALGWLEAEKHQMSTATCSVKEGGERENFPSDDDDDDSSSYRNNISTMGKKK